MIIGNLNSVGRYTVLAFPATSYLLDTYTAAAAYSLRQLKTGVTSVVRARRGGDNAESDFTATEITDGTLESWAVGGGGTAAAIVTWYDQSGNGNDITQSTTNKQPLIVSSSTVITKNGNPAPRFDGTDTLVSSTPVLNSSNISLFSVSSVTTSNNVYAVLGLSDTTNTTYRVFHDARAAVKRHIFYTNTSVTIYFADLSTFRNNTNQVLLSSFMDGSLNISAFDNGATGGTTTGVGSITNDGLTVGADGISFAMVGEIQEVILFNSDESANRTAIESDINTYYSIY